MVKPIMRDVLFLGQKSIPATEEDLQVGRDLQDTLAANREACVGMAANMIGVKKRIIIVNAGFRDIIMFNPVIVRKSGPYETEEGCLSLPGVRKTKRYQNIEIEYYDWDWKNNAKNSPAGQPRSASMRWIIWKGYLFRSYSRQEDGMTDRE